MYNFQLNKLLFGCKFNFFVKMRSIDMSLEKKMLVKWNCLILELHQAILNGWLFGDLFKVCVNEFLLYIMNVLSNFFCILCLVKEIFLAHTLQEEPMHLNSLISHLVLDKKCSKVELGNTAFSFVINTSIFSWYLPRIYFAVCHNMAWHVWVAY